MRLDERDPTTYELHLNASKIFHESHNLGRKLECMKNKVVLRSMFKVDNKQGKAKINEDDDNKNNS